MRFASYALNPTPGRHAARHRGNRPPAPPETPGRPPARSDRVDETPPPRGIIPLGGGVSSTRSDRAGGRPGVSGGAGGRFPLCLAAWRPGVGLSAYDAKRIRCEAHTVRINACGAYKRGETHE